MSQKIDSVDILNPEQQKELLSIAREAIELAVRYDLPDASREYQHKIFYMKFGAFVTLRKGKELRGCIGYVQAIKPLVDTIIEMAQAAALRDPRFEPVTAQEIEKLGIEISVLTPMTKLESVDDLMIGKHGLYIEKGFHRGLLLPQVAVEHGWDKTRFLQQTCIKAGLMPEEWQEPNTDISVFSAQIFSEE